MKAMPGKTSLTGTMQAFVLNQTSQLSTEPNPLQLVELATPVPAAGEILVRVLACGVCHTEIDEIEGRTPPAFFPMIPGHQIVGVVEELGPGTSAIRLGDRVGVAWIHSACRKCSLCRAGKENLCQQFAATGRDAHGGYAEYTTVPESYVYPIPGNFGDVEAAPLLCAGAIGYRSLKLTGIQDGQRLGLTGFGASAHIVLQLAHHLYPRSEIYVFSRSQNEREFALELGAAWTGDTRQDSPERLSAIIDTTPAWTPILSALANLAPGGRLVVNAIRKEEADKSALLQFDYPGHLWLEKEIKTVANITRQDVTEFLALASRIPIKPEVQEYPFLQANQALLELKNRQIRGAKVLRVSN